MGHADEVLVAAPPQVPFLLPERMLAEAQSADAFGHQQVSEAAAGGMQVPVDAPRALRAHALQAPTRAHRSQPALQLRPALVVVLVDGLHWPPVDHARDKARLV